jgi:hypothetical protein
MSKTKRLLKRLTAERGYTLLRIVYEVEGLDAWLMGGRRQPRTTSLPQPRMFSCL